MEGSCGKVSMSLYCNINSEIATKSFWYTNWKEIRDKCSIVNTQKDISPACRHTEATFNSSGLFETSILNNNLC